MNDPIRWVPRLITATAIIHLILGVITLGASNNLRGIVGDGIVNAIGTDSEREAWVWYMVAGAGLLALGEGARWSARETGRVPARLGAWLLAIAVPLIVLTPASGGWLVAAVGGFALRAALHTDPSRPARAHP